MTSVFDPAAFTNLTINDASSTVLVPVPVGEYVALVEKAECRSWQSKDGSQSGLTLDVIWEIQDESVKQLLERQKVTVKQGVMLDLTDDGKGLAMGKGKNVTLGRLREACGKNVPGQAFSFPMLTGCMAKVSVSHRTDPNKPDVIYAEVKQVAKL